MISDALVAPGARALLGEEVSWSGAAWLTTGLLWLQNRLRVGGRRRCGRSGQIARTASACAGAGERGTDGESEAEKGARLGKGRAGADPRRPTRLCEDGADPRCPVGGAEDRLGPSRPDPRPMSDRSLEDARRSDRSATPRADQPLPPLTRRRRSVAARECCLVAASRVAASGEAVERVGRLPAAGEGVAVTPPLWLAASAVWPANSAIRRPHRVYAPHRLATSLRRRPTSSRSTAEKAR